MSRFSGTDGKTNLVSLGNINFLLDGSLLISFILRLKIINWFVTPFIKIRPDYPFALCPVECSGPPGDS
jgi:hypothetical protein